jgi:hypothetical protein
LYYIQGSIWVYDPSWNMENMQIHNIVAEFVTLKRQGMINNITAPHDWDIVVHFSGGSTQLFPAGKPTPVLDAESAQRTMSVTDPLQFSVEGVYDQSSNGFTASIGDDVLRTVAVGTYVDSTPFADEWVGTRDLTPYQTVSAWYIPQGWTEAQVDTWFSDMRTNLSLPANQPLNRLNVGDNPSMTETPTPAP